MHCPIVQSQVALPPAPRWGSCLHAAASKGHADCVTALLEAGWSADLRDEASEAHWTPLSSACINRRTECVRRLLDFGADAKARRTLCPCDAAATSVDGNAISHPSELSSMSLAVILQRDDSVQFLFQDPDTFEELRYSEILSLLLAHGSRLHTALIPSAAFISHRRPFMSIR
jgi:ankyrin repeat protein